MLANASKIKYKNRKYVTYSDEITINDCVYKVNSRKSGLYSTVVKRAVEQLDICLHNWGRVLIVRFDLHQKHYCGDNHIVSRFRKNLFRRMERKYGLRDMGYVWVREIEKAKSQHYHLAVFLDGNKIRHSSVFNRIVEDTWKSLNSSNTVWIPKRPFYDVKNKESQNDAVYRISYLAKARGKGCRDIQAKDYSTSRLIPMKRKNLE